MANNRRSKESKEVIDAVDAAFAGVPEVTASEPEPVTELAQPVMTVVDESNLDRQRLGSLLRRGQRLALHVQAKIALPEFTGWAQDVQHFMNEFGL